MHNPTTFLTFGACFTVAVILTAITLMLLRSEPSGAHELYDADGHYRPRPWDEVTTALGEAYVMIELPDADVEPDPDPEPVDELDPAWDWRAYADAADRELVAA